MFHLRKISKTAAAPTGAVVGAIVPTMPYRNPMVMADWLCEAYGFEKQRIVKGGDGDIKHAQLTFGDSTIMVVPIDDARIERLVVHPDRIGGVETQACYLLVPDIDAHYARAAAKGAEILSSIASKDRDGRGYASRDPEGHVWMFGTYDPSDGRRRPAKHARGGRRLGAYLLALALLGSTVAVAAAVWTLERRAPTATDAVRVASQASSLPPAAARDTGRMADEIARARTAKESAERAAANLGAQLAAARSALQAAVQGEQEARSRLTQEMRAQEGYARAAKQAADQLGQERLARQAAEQSAKDATEQLSRVVLAKTTAERVARETAAKCDLERTARSAAERSAQDATSELARERSARAAAELATSELRTQLAALGSTPQGILELRDQVHAERRAKEGYEREAKDAQIQLAQERSSRDATERELKQTRERLAASSCWACPGSAACSRP